MACSFLASALNIAACFSPSATNIADSLLACASSIFALFSLSAFISFSMADLISAGGIILFSSTLFTLIPHGSVASSSSTLIFVFITSLEVSVWSTVMSPIIFLNVVAVRFSIADIGLSIP